MTGFTLGRKTTRAAACAAALVAVVSVSVMPASARLVNDPSVLRPTGAAGAAGTSTSGGSNAQAISVASRYLGGNPTGQRSRWCADFMNLVEKKMGRDGTGSRTAKSYLGYGKPVSTPKPGDIVVLYRPGGGHVGYFMGYKDGKIELISGNHGRKVGVGTYPKSRVLGFRRP